MVRLLPRIGLYLISGGVSGEHLIRTRLLSIARIEDNPSLHTWRLVRGIFYHFVDNDNSLTAKSSLVYFNGFLWTLAADARAIAAFFVIVSGALWYWNIDNADLAAIFFFLIFVFTLLWSFVLTKRHKALGDEQLEIIQHKYEDELKAMLERASGRGN